MLKVLPAYDGLPDRAAVRYYLEDLIAERRSREEVADWASQFIRGDYKHFHIVDKLAWEMLSTLAAADIKISPTEYLYVQEDFKDWAKQLKESVWMCPLPLFAIWKRKRAVWNYGARLRQWRRGFALKRLAALQPDEKYK